MSVNFVHAHVKDCDLYKLFKHTYQNKTIKYDLYYFLYYIRM